MKYIKAFFILLFAGNLYAAPLWKVASSTGGSTTAELSGVFMVYDSTSATTSSFEVRGGSVTKAAAVISPVGLFSNVIAATTTLRTELTDVAMSTGTLVKKTGDTMSGTLTIGSNVITTSSMTAATGRFDTMVVDTIRPIASYVQFSDTGTANRVRIGVDGTRTGLNIAGGSLYINDTLRWTSAGILRATAGTTAEPAYTFAASGRSDTGFGNFAAIDAIQAVVDGAIVSSYTPTGLHSIAVFSPLGLFSNVIEATTTLRSDIISIDIATGTLRTDLTAIALSTGTLVRKSGDTMTGQLTIDGSSLTITGNAFSVGGSTFVVNNGFVGIGVNNPSVPFYVAGGAQGAQTAFITTSNLSQRILELSSPFGSVANLFTATIGGVGPRFVINNNADVAIGKATPTAKLDVEGNVKFSGNCDIGGNINTSSATITGAFYPPAYNSFPTTGFNAGAVICYIPEQYQLYRATETVVGVESWRKVGE